MVHLFNKTKMSIISLMFNTKSYNYDDDDEDDNDDSGGNEEDDAMLQ